jgi:flagellar M-ring protein FliF
MGAVTIALVGFFAFLILRVTAPRMTPLFTDLAFEDSAAVVKELERQAVPYELRNEGGIVLVPKDKVARLRMALAESGLPKGAGIGYEIFDKSEALGTTSFVQNINNLRALEGELARTIRSLDRVQAARVHLVMPERPLFSRDKVEPSASIVLKVRGALEAQQVRAVRHLVASAVNGLKPQRVSIVDESGRLLADGAASEEGGELSADERRAAFEKRLREQVEAIVSSIVGSGRARVESPPISTSTASPRPRTNTTPRAAWCARARRGRRPPRRTSARTRSPSATKCPAAMDARRPLPSTPMPFRATRTESPRRSSTTRFRRPPRPR